MFTTPLGPTTGVGLLEGCSCSVEEAGGCGLLKANIVLSNWGGVGLRKAHFKIAFTRINNSPSSNRLHNIIGIKTANN